MRLLVLDESRVLVSVVKRVAPPGVEVETANSFDAAWELLHKRSPDALIATLGPTELPWDTLKDYCESHEPKIPVLFESCVHSTPAEAGLGPLEKGAEFVRKPYPLEELKAQIDRLVRTALETRRETDLCEGDPDVALADDLPPGLKPQP
jgi:DNA-binding response OmpR family regulator